MPCQMKIFYKRLKCELEQSKKAYIFKLVEKKVEVKSIEGQPVCCGNEVAPDTIVLFAWIGPHCCSRHMKKKTLQNTMK